MERLALLSSRSLRACAYWLRSLTRLRADNCSASGDCMDGLRARRKPMSPERDVGLSALRIAVRQIAATLPQLPPRYTRKAPLRIVHRRWLKHRLAKPPASRSRRFRKCR